MVKYYQKIGAAHARAARWTPWTQDSNLPTSEHLETTSRPTVASANEDPEPEIFILESDESDCGYQGGVSFTHELDVEAELADSGGADGESVDELEGEELERNLQELQEKEQKMLWDGVFVAQRTKKEWEKAESKRNLGYNGLSCRTQWCREKAAQDGKALHEGSKES